MEEFFKFLFKEIFSFTGLVEVFIRYFFYAMVVWVFSGISLSVLLLLSEKVNEWRLRIAGFLIRWVDKLETRNEANNAFENRWRFYLYKVEGYLLNLLILFLHFVKSTIESNVLFSFSVIYLWISALVLIVFKKDYFSLFVLYMVFSVSLASSLVSITTYYLLLIIKNFVNDKDAVKKSKKK